LSADDIDEFIEAADDDKVRRFWRTIKEEKLRGKVLRSNGSRRKKFLSIPLYYNTIAMIFILATLSFSTWFVLKHTSVELPVDIDITQPILVVIFAFSAIMFHRYVSDKEEIVGVKNVIACALTHPSKEVKVGIAQGIRDFLWETDFEFAQICLYGTVKNAQVTQELLPLFRKLDYRTEKETEENLTIICHKFDELRDAIVNSKVTINTESLNKETCATWELGHVLTIMSYKKLYESQKLILLQILMIFGN